MLYVGNRKSIQFFVVGQARQKFFAGLLSYCRRRSRRGAEYAVRCQNMSNSVEFCRSDGIVYPIAPTYNGVKGDIFLQNSTKKGENRVMSKSKKRILLIAGIILLVAATITACYFIFSNKEEDTGLVYEDNATVGDMPGVDIDERRKQLQEMLDESMIAFSINTSPVFLNGTSEGNLLIENPGNNAKLLKISIVINDTDEEVYSSNFLKPGTYIENAKLDKVLEKGTYDATAYFSAYKEDTGDYIGRTGAQLAITVQN